MQLALQALEIVVLQLDECCTPGSFVTQPSKRCVCPTTRLRLRHV
jgi:hypothetical protein